MCDENPCGDSVCRLLVERKLKVCGNARVKGNLTTDGSLLPHRYVRVGITADQTIPHQTYTPVQFTSVLASHQLAYSTAAGAGNGFLVPQSGLYSFKTSLYWAGALVNGVYSVGLQIRKAGQTSFATQHLTSNAALINFESPTSDSAVYYLGKDDLVQVVTWQNTEMPTQPILAAGIVPTFLEITQLR